MKTAIVRCTFDIKVEIPDDPEYDVSFDIEENHCPGTGRVGAAIDARMRHCQEQGACWACPTGKNEIIEIIEIIEHD